MKSNYFLLFSALTGVALFLNACKKDSSKTYVESFVPVYSESKGTSYDGTYYPLTTGYLWNYTGTMNITGSETDNGTKQSLNTDSVINEVVQVIGPTSVQLSSGTQDAIKVQDGSGTEYFKIETDGIHEIGGTTSSSGNFYETKNTLYLKTPLIVGDSWSVDPGYR